MRSKVWRNLSAWTLVGGCLALASCSGNGDGDVPDGGGGAGGSGIGTDASVDVDAGSTACVPGASATCPATPVLYATVQPIIQQKCVEACHNGKTIDPKTTFPIWALDTHQDLVDWTTALNADMSNCSMPPADAGAFITVEERRAILAWISCGLP